MNTTLGLYFDDEQIFAAMEPFEGKFSVLGKRGKQSFPLFFSIENGRISYGHSYKNEFYSGKPGLIGEIYQLILQKNATFLFQDYEQSYTYLLDYVLNDLKDLYFRSLSSISDKTLASLSKHPIPTHFAYSDNIPPEVFDVIVPHLNHSGFTCKKQNHHSFPELFIRNLFNNKRIPVRKGTYAVVEALNDDLNISLLDTASGKPKRIKFESFPGYGTDPRIQVLARYVVDEVNRGNGFLSSQKDREAEYKKHLFEAVQWNERLIHSSKPFINVRVSLSSSPHSTSMISIPQKNIDDLTRARSSQIVRFFQRVMGDKESLDQLEHIVIVGDTLKNSHVLEGFKRLGEERIWLRGNNQVLDVLKCLLEKDLDASVPSLQTPRTNLFYEIISDSLNKGEKIEICWKPNRKILAKYLGENTYKILSHEHSKVIAGDTFQATKFKVGEPMSLQKVKRAQWKNPKSYTSGTKIVSLRKLR